MVGNIDHFPSEDEHGHKRGLRAEPIERYQLVVYLRFGFPQKMQPQKLSDNLLRLLLRQTQLPHEQLFGAALCGIYDDGDEEDGYILCLDNGHVIHLHTAYMYSDPTAGWYRTLHFYTPLRLSDIDYLDFATCITQARMHGARILVK